MTQDHTGRKRLCELRVVDLRNELEKRSLNTAGVKSALLERLQTALRDEGLDPDTHEFEVSSDAAAAALPQKAASGSSARKSLGSGKEETSDDVEDTVGGTGGSLGDSMTSFSKHDLVASNGGDGDDGPHNEEAGLEVHPEENNEFDDDIKLAEGDGDVEEADDDDDDAGADEKDDEDDDDDQEDDDQEDETTGASLNKKSDSGSKKSTLKDRAGTGVAAAGTKDLSIKDASGGKDSADVKSDKTAKGREDESASVVPVESVNVWISALPHDTKAAEIKKLCSKYGKISSAKVVTNAKSPKSGCYGYVTMNTLEDAKKCVAEMNGSDYNGHKLAVEMTDLDPAGALRASASKKKSAAAAAAKKSDPQAPSSSSSGAKKKVISLKKDTTSSRSDKKKEDGDGEVIKVVIDDNKEDSDKANRKKVSSNTSGPDSGSGVSRLRDRSRDRGNDIRKRLGPRGLHPIGMIPRGFRGGGRGMIRGGMGLRGRGGVRGGMMFRGGGRPGFMGDRIPPMVRFMGGHHAGHFRELPPPRHHHHHEDSRERERKRELERRHRDEAFRLERERERIRIERERLEREKLELLRLERERQRVERERIAREREELMRRKMDHVAVAHSRSHSSASSSHHDVTRGGHAPPQKRSYPDDPSSRSVAPVGGSSSGGDYYRGAGGAGTAKRSEYDRRRDDALPPPPTKRSRDDVGASYSSRASGSGYASGPSRDRVEGSRSAYVSSASAGSRGNGYGHSGDYGHSTNHSSSGASHSRDYTTGGRTSSGYGGHDSSSNTKWSTSGGYSSYSSGSAGGSGAGSYGGPVSRGYASSGSSSRRY